MPRNPKTLIPVGVTFGRLTVIDSVADIDGHPASKVRCTCGTEKLVRNSTLLKGSSNSCGCARFMRMIETRNGQTAKKPDPGCRIIQLTDTRHNAHDGINSCVLLPRGMSSTAMI